MVTDFVETQACRDKVEKTAEAFSAALKDAKRAGLHVTIEPWGQGVAVKCWPIGPTHDYHDGGAPVIVSSN
jgi:hypothetical protein